MSNWEGIEILLVEDNPSDMELALIALERKAICNKIHVVCDGEEALDFLFCRNKYKLRSPKNKIKVVLLDLKLPKIDGLEVLKEIKTNSLTKLIPVVVLTSSCEEKDVYYAYQLGVNSFITKPVNFDQFILTIGRIGFYWVMINQIPKVN